MSWRGNWRWLLVVDCARCEARIGSPCVSLLSGKPTDPHNIRVRDARRKEGW